MEPTANNDGHYEQRASHVAPEAKEPVHEQVLERQPPVHPSNASNHVGTSEEFRARDQDHDDAAGEDQATDHSDQTGGVFLEPWGGSGDDGRGGGEADETAGHEGREEDLVGSCSSSHGTNPRHQLGCLLWRVGRHVGHVVDVDVCDSHLVGWE